MLINIYFNTHFNKQNININNSLFDLNILFNSGSTHINLGQFSVNLRKNGRFRIKKNSRNYNTGNYYDLHLIIYFGNITFTLSNDVIDYFVHNVIRKWDCGKQFCMIQFEIIAYIECYKPIFCTVRKSYVVFAWIIIYYIIC